MRLFRPALVLVLLLLTSSLPGNASPTIDFVGGGVVRGDLGVAGDEPKRTAAAALRTVADRLNVDPAEFRFDSVRRSLVGVHVRGRQVRDGIVVDGSSAAVHIVDGRVVQVEARAVRLPGSGAAAPLTQRAAVDAALAHLDVSTQLRPAGAQRLMVDTGDELTDVWRVAVLAAAPAVAAHVDVAASTGQVIAVHDARLRADGTATVFDPNPVVSTRNADLRQPGEMGLPADPDLDSAALTAALKVLPVREYDATAIAAGQLSGPWADVQGPASLVSAPGETTFSFTRGDPRFETPMVYTHIDRFQRYIQSLGFTEEAGVNAEPQVAYALPIQGFDNSFYMGGGQDILAFGAGGVDDAEDAEVILHEYGHAVHDDQVPGWGSRHEGGAMGEGFGDWLAAAYYAAELSGGFQDPCIMDWDATSYSSADPPCLRRTDKPKTYPKDMTNNSVHADGELWSAFLWRLRAKLGETPVEQTDNSMRLVLTSHEFLTTTAGFGDAIAALRLAADALEEPEWPALIDETAAETNMPLNP